MDILWSDKYSTEVELYYELYEAILDDFSKSTTDEILENISKKQLFGVEYEAELRQIVEVSQRKKKTRTKIPYPLII